MCVAYVSRPNLPVNVAENVGKLYVGQYGVIVTPKFHISVSFYDCNYFFLLPRIL